MSLKSSELSVYTGTLLEEEFFPRCQETVSWENTCYMPRKRAMLIARNSQPDSWRPTDPYPRMANDLHAYVCEGLGEQNFSKVRMYSAAGTALDRFHGIDGWFEYQGKEATVDITANGHKANAYKADVVVSLRGRDDELRGYGTIIADLLRNGDHSPFASFRQSLAFIGTV